jgi:HEAT repeat protein
MQRYLLGLVALLAPLSMASAQVPPTPTPPRAPQPVPLEPLDVRTPRVRPARAPEPRVRAPQARPARVHVPRAPIARVRTPHMPTPQLDVPHVPEPRMRMPLNPTPPGDLPLAPPIPVEPRVPGQQPVRPLAPRSEFDTRPARESLARRPQFYQGDPADSLYRAAYAYFTRQEYRPAAERFSSVRSRYPNSRYVCDAAYYEAFARHRLGTLNDLRAGYNALDGISARCPPNTQRDVPELTIRINSALARLGDGDAANRLRQKAAQGQSVCDREERTVKMEALNALAQMDAGAVAPVLRTVMNTKDECSAPIRRQAIGLIARRNDSESVTLLGQVARTDPDRDNQAEAVRALGRMSNDAAYAALEDFFRTSGNERLQIEAASTMARSENARARTAVRALIERTDVAERIRLTLIQSLSSNSTLSTDYWKTLYGKVESDELRRAIVGAIARNGGDDAQQWLTALARNPDAGYAAREAALARVRSTAPIADLYQMFEIADTRSMRLSIVSGLSARREPEATDRLIQIARTGTDPEVRYAAIRALRQAPRNADPKVLKALGDIAGGCCQP